MPNQYVTVKWLTEDALKMLGNQSIELVPGVSHTVPIRVPVRYPNQSWRVTDCSMTGSPAAPLDGRTLAALGAAAVIANPEPISRRSFFGGRLFGRRKQT